MSAAVDKRRLAFEAKTFLLEQLHMNSRIYSLLTSTSRQGTSRRYRFLVVDPYNEIRDISVYVGRVLGLRVKDGGTWEVVVGGSGFDGAAVTIGELGETLGLNLAHSRL